MAQGKTNVTNAKLLVQFTSEAVDEEVDGGEALVVSYAIQLAQGDLSRTEASTLLRKIRDSLSSFNNDTVIGLNLDVRKDTRKFDEAINKTCQERYEKFMGPKKQTKGTEKEEEIPPIAAKAKKGRKRKAAKAKS